LVILSPDTLIGRLVVSDGLLDDGVVDVVLAVTVVGFRVVRKVEVEILVGFFVTFGVVVRFEGLTVVVTPSQLLVGLQERLDLELVDTSGNCSLLDSENS
jgi:hypothetical protein